MGNLALASGEEGPQADTGAFPDVSYQVPTASGMLLTVIPASKWDLSPPLTELIKIPSTLQVKVEDGEVENHALPKYWHAGEAAYSSGLDGALQTWQGTEAMPSPSANWDGLGNLDSVLPPDPSGAIGPGHYMQWINLHMAIWDRSGTLVWGPQPGNIIWTGFGGPCDTCNSGDPIVLYDRQAGRWLVSQFAIPASGTGPFYQYVAVSTSSDPTGSWYRYAFTWPGNALNDYPKFGIWPDGYYMTANQFNAAGTAWLGAGVAALDRTAMLAGAPATILYFNLFSANANFGGMLPCDLDGPVPPPGAPAYFGEVDDSSTLGPNDAFRIWEFHTDWATPANTTFGLAGQPNQALDVAPFTPLCAGTRSCIPQPGTTARLDAIGDRLMYRLQYRNFGGYQTLVTNHTVDAGSGVAGVRWYELRNSGSGWSIYQQGTYSPDADSRWMGSIAMNKSGTMAVGYSVSSATVNPSIRYAGRLSTDPLGTLPQSEVTLIAGSGAQTSSSSRWGDYTMLTLDPTDDCTFWYTGEYMGTTSSAGWKTRIGAFQVPCCITPGTPTIGTATVPGTNLITVSWTAGAPAGVTYNLYRSTGACPGGAYTLVKSGQPSSPWTDTTVSGGIAYSYKVTAVDTTGGCESLQSGCASATATGPCIAAPTFGGITSVANPATASCGLLLNWAAGTSGCPGGSVTYSIYRSTYAPFTPSLALLLATGIPGATTTYTDTNAIFNGVTYYYTVRAVDSINGLSDGNTTTKSGVPTGVVTTTTQLLEGFEVAAPAGWTYFAGAGTDDWAQNMTQKHGGASSFFSSDPAVVKDDYLVSPSFTLGASGQMTLSFWHTYSMESTFDGCVIEINDGGGWVDLGSKITAGGYNGTISSSFSSPIAGRQAWTGGTVGAFTQVTVDLSSYATKTCQIRFRLASDTSVARTGWYVDDLLLTTQTTAGCSALFSLPPETAPGANLSVAQQWSGKTTHFWSANSQANYYNLYRGQKADLPNLIAGSADNACLRGAYLAGTSLTLTEAPPAAGDFYWYLVTGSNIAGEGTSGSATAGTRTVRYSAYCP